MTREEYIQRFADRLMAESGCPAGFALENAQTSAEDKEWLARVTGREVEWADPEAAADDEMSYWEDDE